MKVIYTESGIEKTTENVWIEWPDGFCFLVVGPYGVIGAVITMNEGERGWHEAYEAAIDEVAWDVFPDDEAEAEEWLKDGTIAYRGSGEPSNPRRSSVFACTDFNVVPHQEYCR